MKTLASILNILIVDVFKSQIPVKNENQSHLDGAVRIKPRSGPIMFKPAEDLKDTSDESDAAKKKGDEYAQIMGGLYSKDDLSPYFIKTKL